jgi:hypothetical protein
MANKWIKIVEEYLKDAGFSEELYYIHVVNNGIEVDFDDQEAVFYLIDDLKKSLYNKFLMIDYKKSVNTKRHTAVFYPRKF